MKDLTKKIATVAATSALLFGTALPVLGVSIELTGNGEDSYNKADVEVENSVFVEQVNEAYISNDVVVDADSGHNDANRNTGGDVTVSTGDSGALVTVNNQANSNIADVEGCCGVDADVLISGNGADSKNKVYLDINEDLEGPATYVGQFNDAEVYNDVDMNTSTGYNDANRNTGGDVEVTTGSAYSATDIKTALNSNSAYVGGGEGGALSAQILGNGENSYNKIDLDYEMETVVLQDNDAYVWNGVYADAKTGYNDANRNTGGGVEISTGDAGVDIAIDNMANFNAADVECGCLMDVWAKIGGNGADSYNKIEAELESYSGVKQGNFLTSGAFDNLVDVSAKTGKNDANGNTGDPGDDPSVDTGNSAVVVDIGNAGNTNVYGNGMGWVWPEMPGMDFGEMHFSWSWASMWGMFGLNL